MLLHVIDASNPEWREQVQVVDQLILELGAEQTPRIEVFNKCDKWTGEIRPHGEDIVSISAKTGEGLDKLMEAIGKRLDSGAKRVTIHLPTTRAAFWTSSIRRPRVEKVSTPRPSTWWRCVPPRPSGSWVPWWRLAAHKEPWED